MMPRQNRSFKLRWTSTLLSLCLLGGEIGGSLTVPWCGAAQTPPTLSAEQATALKEAERLNQQVMQLYRQGKFNEAIPLAESILVICRRALSENHPAVTNSLNNLVFLYQNQGYYDKAGSLLKQTLELRKRTLGENHSLVASSLNNLAFMYHNQGRYSEAETLYKQALALQKRTLGENHSAVAISLNNLAELYRSQGRYSEAEPLNKQALALRKDTFGENHPDVALSLNNLAALYDDQGRYSEAELLYKQALELRTRTLGENHSDVAQSLNNLALLYSSQGRYNEVEPLYKRALELYRRNHGENHPTVARSLNNLALLYDNQGRYSEAEPLYKQALELWKRRQGENHPDVASSFYNLAELYRNQGRYSKAEPFYKQALQLKKRTLGENHPDVATILNGLAGLYNNQGRYSEAEPLYKQALALRKRTLDNHPDIATNLNDLALLYNRQGRYSEAEPLYKQALALRKRTLGENHPTVATSLNNLALLYQGQGDAERSLTFLTQGLQIQERNLGINLAIGAEAQKQSYLATIAYTTDIAISLHLRSVPTNLNAARLALTTLLQRKGRILDTLTDNLNSLRQNLVPADQKRLNELAITRTQLATLFYGGLGKLSPEQYRSQTIHLQQQATQLEADLNNRSAEFRNATQPITLAAIQNQIPTDAVLVELVRYKPFNPKAKLAEQWGRPRYAAYILSPQGTIQAADLGDANAIDQQVETFRQALRSRDARVKAIARKLDSVLMQPIRAKLGNTRNLLISPDSQLNLIPFAALVDEQNRYLVETTNISYLTSGRDLLRLQNSVASRQPPVLLANPDYANPGNPSLARTGGFGKTIARSPDQSGKPAPTDRGTNQRSSDLARLQFGPLPGTAAEANAIAPKLPNVTLLTGANATENVLKQVRSPNILHIATHGFFLEDIPLPAPASRGFSGDRSDVFPSSQPGFRPSTRPGNTENALLRSGLALAGFNPRKSSEEDGVLTALEAAGLNLRGTQLVVLSACETGIGDIANGEGVYGLRRAFVLAGAESQLISLWKVDDQGTKDLMVRYYDRLLAKAGRSDALRQIQLEFLKNPTYQHPYYWAAFIPSGDWRSLKN